MISPLCLRVCRSSVSCFKSTGEVTLTDDVVLEHTCNHCKSAPFACCMCEVRSTTTIKSTLTNGLIGETNLLRPPPLCTSILFPYVTLQWPPKFRGEAINVMEARMHCIALLAHSHSIPRTHVSRAPKIKGLS